MAHFVGIRVDLAAWGIGTPVTPDEYWLIDSQLRSAINGDGGGTWAPAAAIVIGGAGISMPSGAGLSIGSGSGFSCAANATFDGTANFNDWANFYGSVQLGNGAGDTILFGGTSTFNQPATFTDWVYVNYSVNLGSSAAHEVNISGTAEFFENAAFDKDVTFGTSDADVVTVNATTTIVNALTLGAASETVCQGLARESGEGQFLLSTVFLGDASTTASSRRSRFIYVSLSDHRTLTIDFVGIEIGDAITVINKSPTYNVTILDSGASPYGAVGAGTKRYAQLIWNGSAWVFFQEI